MKEVSALVVVAPSQGREYVERVFNCDDLLLNYLMAATLKGQSVGAGLCSDRWGCQGPWAAACLERLSVTVATACVRACVRRRPVRGLGAAHQAL